MKYPFGTLSITQEAKRLVMEALDSARVSCGSLVHRFEEMFAERAKAKEAVAVSTGTDADALALAVMYDFGAGRGDEVIVPALSFVSTGNAVLQAGFTPVFIDVDKKTFNIDPSLIESKIGPKTRAIMPVHLMGKPAAMDEISAIAKKHRLFVVEDAAEAHGALYDSKPVGTLSDMGAFSLYVAHIITTIEGGIVITSNERYAEILRSLRSHGRACACKSCAINTSSSYCPKRFLSETGQDIRFMFERIGFSAKMNELEAAVGIGSMELYDTILLKRRKNLAFLLNEFVRFEPWLSTFEEGPREKIGPHAFPVIVNECAPFTREEYAGFLEKNGIETRTLFSSMPTQCTGFAFLGYEKGQFPNAEFIGLRGLHIGVHQDLTPAHLEYFLSKTQEFLKQKEG